MKKSKTGFRGIAIGFPDFFSKFHKISRKIPQNLEKTHVNKKKQSHIPQNTLKKPVFTSNSDQKFIKTGKKTP
jgi:hypothetical protein